MLRQTLLLLREDVNRLLSRGVGGSPGPRKMAQHANTLQRHARAVPALVRIVEAIGRATSAPGLLDLLLRQAVAALSTSGVPGELTLSPSSGPWQTPFPVQDIAQVAQALRPKGKDCDRLVNDALQRGLFADLRLASDCLDCLPKDKGMRCRVAPEGLPQLGPAVLPELRQGLDLKGTTSDARRLAAICRIDRAAGAELCRLALRGGSDPKRKPDAKAWRAKSGVPVLVEALRRVPEVMAPAEAEQFGLAFSDDGDARLRGAALAALRGATSDEALERLLDAIGWDEARTSLVTLPHPATTRRLLAKLHEAVAALDPPVPPQPDTRSTETDLRQAPAWRIWSLAWVLGLRRDDADAEVAAVLVALTRHPHPQVRDSAVHALQHLGSSDEQVVARLVEILETPFNDPRQPDVELFGALYALEKVPCAQREPALPVLLRLVGLPNLNEQFHRIILSVLPCPDSPHLEAIRSVLVAELFKKREQDFMLMAYRSLRSLGELGSAARADIPAILEYFYRRQHGTFILEPDFVQVLPRIDPSGEVAIPGLIELLRTGSTDAVRSLTLRMLAAYGPLARPALPLVANLAANGSSWVQTTARAALAAIQGTDPIMG